MTPRRFQAGWEHRIPGPVFTREYRVVPGEKGSDDLRLDWRIVTQWQRVCLDDIAVTVDQVYENEERLYPPPEYKGGGKVTAFVLGAIQRGYAYACNHLYVERQHTREAS